MRRPRTGVCEWGKAEPASCFAGRARTRPLFAPVRSTWNFFLLWAGGRLSSSAPGCRRSPSGAPIVARTGSATWAVVIAAGGVPADWAVIAGRRRVSRPDTPARGPCRRQPAGLGLSPLIAILVAAGHDSPVILMFFSSLGLQGSVSASNGPFQQAILPDLVPTSEFLAAVSLNSAQFNLGRIIGPAWAVDALLATRSPSSPTPCPSSLSSWPCSSYACHRRPDATIGPGRSPRFAAVPGRPGPSLVVAMRSASSPSWGSRRPPS